MVPTIVTMFSETYLKELVNLAVEEKISSLSLQFNDVKERRILMSRKETIKFLDISYPTLSAWVKQGKLNAHKKGNRIYFIQNEIMKSLEDINYSHFIKK